MEDANKMVNRVALAALLNEWMRGDETEQRETFEALRRSLDEDRPEGYKHFCAPNQPAESS